MASIILGRLSGQPNPPRNTVFEITCHAKPPRGANSTALGSRIPALPAAAEPSGTTPFKGSPDPGTKEYSNALKTLAGSGAFGNAGSISVLVFAGFTM